MPIARHPVVRFLLCFLICLAVMVGQILPVPVKAVAPEILTLAADVIRNCLIPSMGWSIATEPEYHQEIGKQIFESFTAEDKTLLTMTINNSNLSETNKLTIKRNVFLQLTSAIFSWLMKHVKKDEVTQQEVLVLQTAPAAGDVELDTFYDWYDYDGIFDNIHFPEYYGELRKHAIHESAGLFTYAFTCEAGYVTVRPFDCDCANDQGVKLKHFQFSVFNGYNHTDDWKSCDFGYGGSGRRSQSEFLMVPFRYVNDFGTQYQMRFIPVTEEHRCLEERNVRDKWTIPLGAKDVPAISVDIPVERDKDYDPSVVAGRWDSLIGKFGPGAVTQEFTVGDSQAGTITAEDVLPDALAKPGDVVIPGVDVPVIDVPDISIPDIDIALPNVPALTLPKVIITKFPFCIPFDVFRALQLFVAPPVKPEFRVPFRVPNSKGGYLVNEEIVLNLDRFDKLIEIMRWLQIICYSVLLAASTRKFIKW